FQHASDERRDLCRSERLLDVVESAVLDRVDRNVERAVRGHDNDLGGRSVGLYKTEQIDSAGVRKTQVREDEIVRRTFDELFGLAAVFCRVYVMAQIHQ